MKKAFHKPGCERTRACSCFNRRSYKLGLSATLLLIAGTSSPLLRRRPGCLVGLHVTAASGCVDGAGGFAVGAAVDGPLLQTDQRSVSVCSRMCRVLRLRSCNAGNWWIRSPSSGAVPSRPGVAHLWLLLRLPLIAERQPTNARLPWRYPTLRHGVKSGKA